METDSFVLSSRWPHGTKGAGPLAAERSMSQLLGPPLLPGNRVETLRNGCRFYFPTFPSRWPLLPLDYVFATDDLEIRTLEVPSTALPRDASDHLLDLPAPRACL